MKKEMFKLYRKAIKTAFQDANPGSNVKAIHVLGASKNTDGQTVVNTEFMADTEHASDVAFRGDFCLSSPRKVESWRCDPLWLAK